MLDIGSKSLGDKLSDVLRRKYQENCPNCERNFSLSDLNHDHVEGQSRYRVTCQDCGQIFVEINKDGNYGDEVSDFIKVLDEGPG